MVAAKLCMQPQNPELTYPPRIFIQPLRPDDEAYKTPSPYCSGQMGKPFRQQKNLPGKRHGRFLNDPMHPMP
ncbi:hypothetical protein HK15_00115 [Acetobacter orientalis]|uniref:Uncharacterized protein n=1 Tax=Acetobacter orientalis TaxID=146474 RepID=A0A252BG12_9PROT|nr:hypothetical protein HK15_00115 [Acetobacter orientalis]